MFTRTLLATAAMAIALPVLAHHDEDSTTTGAIAVSHAHTVATSATAHGIDVFVTIENTGDTPVTLTGASVDFAAPGVLQSPVVTDGTLAVREIDALEIAAGQTLTMQPGGVHITFQDVQRSYTPGDHFHASLEFEGQGEVEVDVAVEAAPRAPEATDDLG